MKGLRTALARLWWGLRHLLGIASAAVTLLAAVSAFVSAGELVVAHRNPAPVVLGQSSAAWPQAEGTWTMAMGQRVEGEEVLYETRAGDAPVSNHWGLLLQQVRRRSEAYTLVRLYSGHHVAVVESRGGRWFTYAQRWRAYLPQWMAPLLPEVHESREVPDQGEYAGIAEPLPLPVQEYYRGRVPGGLPPYAINVGRAPLPLQRAWGYFLLSLGGTLLGALGAGWFWDI